MRKVLALSICALVFVAGAYAQATAGLGSVSGTVRDASGAVIPGATVVVANEGKGIKRTMNTTDAGVFAAPAWRRRPATASRLPSRASPPTKSRILRFWSARTWISRSVLQIGSATTKVDVTAEAPLVEDTKSGVTATVGSDQIDNLPINGRRVDSFVLLTPAVTNDGEFGLISFRGIAGGQRLPHGRQRHHQQFLQRERRPHAHRQPALAGRGAGIPGAVQRLLGRVRPRHGRRDQHRHQERRQQHARHRLLVLPQPHAGSRRPLLQRHQDSGMASHRRRQPRRRAEERQALLLRQFRLHQPQFPGPEPHRQQHGNRSRRATLFPRRTALPPPPPAVRRRRSARPPSTSSRSR